MTEAAPSSYRAALEKLLIDNPDFERLEILLGEFNLFEALGVARQELRHSDFLGFVLDPRKNHGLGESFLTIFLRKVLQSSDLAGLPFTALDVTLWDLAETEVRREWKNIDILLLNRSLKLAVVIENKIGSSEHSQQLQRYIETVRREFPGWKHVGIYLTPEGEEPSEETFIPCAYSLVNESIKALLESRTAAMGAEVRAAVTHYSQLLERHVVVDSEISELCQRIYRQHQQALDLIFEHRPDRAALALESVLGMVQKSDTVVLDHCTKSSVRFVPKSWDVPQMAVGEGWTPSGRMLLFELRNDSRRGLVMLLYIGPGPDEVREALFTAAVQSDLLRPTSKGLNKKWNAIFSGRTVIDYEALYELDGEELEARLRGFWEGFSTREMPGIVDALMPAIEALPGRVTQQLA